jgi:nicotinate-nucleotide adenylyltransferase
MEIGVLGGTFDPVHNGHVEVAKEARVSLNLDTVLFVPVRQPWMKSDRPITPVEHRVQMVRLAISDYPFFCISMVDVERAGPTYTVDTITQLKRQFGSGSEFFVILGWDSLLDFPQWEEASRLVTMCRLVAAPRPGYRLPDLEALESRVPGLAGRVILLEKPEVDVSATEIRRRVASGLSIHGLVPGAVERYIREHGLYAAAI